MKKIELILVSGFFIALLLKSFLIGFGNTLTGLTLNFLAIFYFICSVPLFLNIAFKKIFSKAAYSGISILRIVGTVAIAYCLAIVTIGLMFKLLILPGSGVMLSVGLNGLVIVTLVSIFKLFRSINKNFYKSVLLRLIPTLIIGFLFHRIPTNKQVAFFYRDNPEFVELYDQFYNDPANEELDRKVQEAFRAMDN